MRITSDVISVCASNRFFIDCAPAPAPAPQPRPNPTGTHTHLETGFLGAPQQVGHVGWHALWLLLLLLFLLLLLLLLFLATRHFDSSCSCFSGNCCSSVRLLQLVSLNGETTLKPEKLPDQMAAESNPQGGGPYAASRWSKDA